MTDDRTPLARYLDHAKAYGPEAIEQTAARDRHMSERDRGELHQWLVSRARSYYWQVGRAGGPNSEWRLKRTLPRECEFCGLDLGASANPRRRFHDHCGAKASRERRARRESLNPGEALRPAEDTEPQHGEGFGPDPVTPPATANARSANPYADRVEHALPTTSKETDD